ncbi:uncharacterized protein LOC8057647 isoform X2 [Sorghum bicolor]|uniref:uncharacterized protein LOC8057647 isoform X2 n=1 Tax=Sorghum bicolor TaxID=4558 RepID=UPI000B425BC2|nr:uncharacterized protein LOC8057647 isoform X2 [Sorghum bicolor]|eukprot:XP_021307705.1 uncharacterized protein LOC8057647 isoform X2 [Sorghum bicolor]
MAAQAAANTCARPSRPTSCARALLTCRSARSRDKRARVFRTLRLRRQSRRSAPRPALWTPLAGALLFFSVSAAVACSCRIGCAISHRRLPFLGASSLNSARMESASTIVPTIVVYVTVPNREAGAI